MKRSKKKKHPYKSNLENNTAERLDEEGIKFTYEKKKLKYTIPESCHTYTPDLNLSIFEIECKGAGPRYGLTVETKRKMLLVKEQYPDEEIRFVFQFPNELTGQGKGKPKITYWQWAELNGFKWSGPILPKEWIEELKED